MLGINLASKYCYFTDSDCGKYEHCEGELFGTKAEAEFAVEILRSNTGGIKEIPLDEILEVIKAEKPDRLSASWLQRKFRIGYSRAFRLLDELRERAPKDGAD